MTTEFLGYSNKFERIYTCGIQEHNETIQPSQKIQLI